MDLIQVHLKRTDTLLLELHISAMIDVIKLLYGVKDYEHILV